MSLTNPNTPVSQQDLKDFYDKLLPFLGGGGKKNYSSDETVIGTWNDNEILYEKVVSEATESIYGNTQVLVNSLIDVSLMTDTGHEGNNKFSNVLTDNSGEGKNWYSPSVSYGIVVFTKPIMLKRVFYKTTENYGKAYYDHNFYYSDDDSMDLTNYSQYTLVHHNVGTSSQNCDYTFSTAVKCKRLVFVKPASGAMCYLALYGLNVESEITTLDFDLTNVDKIISLRMTANAKSKIDNMNTNIYSYDSSLDKIVVDNAYDNSHVIQYTKSS